MAKKKTYEISVRVIVDTNLTIQAENYEQAVQKGRELGVKDVVEFDTDFNDGSVAITGVYNLNEEPHK